MIQNERVNYNNEVWRNVIGFIGSYQISNKGRLKSIERRVPFKDGTMLVKEKVRKLQFDKNGYHIASVTLNSIHSTLKIHREVAKAFIPNPDNKPFVNHKDGDKTNNCVDNLEWVTAKENSTHMVATGLQSPLINSKLSVEDIHFIRKSDKLQKDLAQMFKISQSAISSIQNHKKFRRI